MYAYYFVCDYLIITIALANQSIKYIDVFISVPLKIM